MLQIIKSFIFNALYKFCFSGSGSSSSSCYRDFRKNGDNGIKNDVLQLQKIMLQMLQMLFFFFESKYSKGFNLVTCFKNRQYLLQNVTKCYNRVTKMLQKCYSYK